MPQAGILYYTHKTEGDIYETCRKQIDRAAGHIPLVNVSLSPLPWRKNIVVDLEPSILTMFKQQLIGLQNIDTDYVFFCEHDVIYHPSHFDFVPPREDMYYFNLNVWAVDAEDGKALYYDGMKMTSGLVAYRPILIEHYTKKIKWVEEFGYHSRRRMGFEPGKKVSAGRVDDYEWDTYRSAYPNVDIKHCGNITRKRFDQKEYRSRRLIAKSWILTDEIPYWGKTKPFKDFLRNVEINKPE